MRQEEPVLFVSAYTRHTPYEALANELIASLRRLSLPHRVYPILNLGSWEKNCQQKADVIAQALDAHRRPIVWIDADAIVHTPPVFFDGLHCDFAFHYLSTPQNPHELLTGTLYVGHTPKAREVVEEWRGLNASNREWDQRNLQRVIEARGDLTLEQLPAEYLKIDGFEEYQRTDQPAVITHHQASRQLKALINNGAAGETRTPTGFPTGF